MELLWCAVIGIGAGCSYYTGTPAVRPRFLWNSFSETVFLCKWTPHQRLFCLEDHLCVIFRDIFREGCYWIWISHDLVGQVNGSRQLHSSSRCLNTCAAWVSVERIEQIHCIDTGVISPDLNVQTAVWFASCISGTVVSTSVWYTASSGSTLHHEKSIWEHHRSLAGSCAEFSVASHCLWGHSVLDEYC